MVVVGASSGGFAVLRQLAADLPPNLPCALFVVWHMPSEATGVLPHVLSQAGPLPAAHAVDGQPIEPGRIYVAPPDHHLLLEPGRMRVTRGPKEHHFRPAVDPLFRSAAYAYGPRVVGVVVSGALDDGAAGLRAIKRYGGTAIVQDPHEAEMPAMPANALRAVEADYVVPVAELAALIVRLCHEPAGPPAGDDANTPIEIRIAAEEHPLAAGVLSLGAPSHFTCPDCHGSLLALRDGPLLRFRCHTGHAFSAESLLAALSDAIEGQLWSAVRGVDERALLLDHLGDHLAERNEPKLAARYYRRANQARLRAEQVRQAVIWQADEPPDLDNPL